MATRKDLSLIYEIPNFANAYLGKVTKFQGYSLFRFGVMSNLLAWRWNPPSPGTNKVKLAMRVRPILLVARGLPRDTENILVYWKNFTSGLSFLSQHFWSAFATS